MKKIIIAIVAVVLVAACATGAYFAFFGTDKNASPDLDIVVDDFAEGVSFLEAVVKNPERYKTKLGKEYQMADETVADFFEMPEEWVSYEQTIVLYNIGENDLTVYGFDIKDNGKNGVYVSTVLGGELGIPVGGHGTAIISVLCDDGDKSVEEVKAIVDKMEISAVYTKSPVEYDDGTVSVEETKLALINTANN